MTVPQCIRQRGAVLRRRQRQDRPHSTCKVCLGLVIVLALCQPASMSAANGAGAYTNTSVASPVRSATVPLSSYQSGLVTRPNPLDNSSNRVITGNVGGGKHFRADIPYRSATSINAPMGSTSLDSFMRYTATAQTPGGSAGTYSPYYSPTGTTTTTQPGARSVLVPGTSSTGSSVAAPPILTPRLAPATDVDTWAGDTTLGALPPLRLWSQSRTSDSTRGVDLQRPLEPPIDRRVSAQEPDIVTGDEYERQMELLQARLVQIQTELMALERSVSPTEEKLPSDQTPPAQNLSRREELLEVTARLLAATKSPTSDHGQEEERSPVGGTTAAPKTGSGAESPLELYDPGRQATQMRQTVSATARQQASAHTTPQGSVGAGTDTSRTPTDVSGSQRGGQTARTPAQAVSGQTDSASVRAFARHLNTAEHQFNCGQYTQAAKSFALASDCLPNNARAHLVRSQALFAAGQYAGSVHSLARAIELDLEYALRPFDFIRIAGGPDAFIARFNELEKAVQTGKTPQLQLLLAYVYYQMQRPEEARIAVAAAQQALPSSIPVDLLKTAIDK